MNIRESNSINVLLDDKIIRYYDSQEFKNFSNIGSGGFSTVHAAYWKNTTKFAIKKFNGSLSSMKEIINEINLMMIASHPNIIRFYGVTKLKDESDKINYSFVLEYADGGTLEKHLKDNTKSLIKWEIQFKFAKGITGAILWLHDNKIIHGDLHPKNILIHQNTIKLSDFGCSRSLQQEKDSYTLTKPRGNRGIIPYVDPKILNNVKGYDLNEKSDIYSLGVIFWELTSCSSPFNYETSNDNAFIILKILGGEREKPIPNTNDKFIALYEKCWRQEPDERPDIHKVNSELIKIIDSTDPKVNISLVNNFKESETTVILRNDDSDLSNLPNLPSCDDCDINSDKYQI
ncbi:kinase-like protein [Rhizophagus irregularis]|uniref:Kinase-like protein n=1 Tax=Rhizophagus irregularis TaxID=588596 RepID=A0A2I1GP36_9GLOM|nr:kinase-like protein [Rhizophagus irregularis]